MTRKYKFIDALFAGLLLVLVWGLLVRQAPYRLEFKEQISIFLLGADRMGWYLSNPGVLSSIAGDWLTQFFINGSTGAMLSVLLLVAVAAGIGRFVKLSVPECSVIWVLIVIPVFLEGYFIPFPNYPVSATVGLALAVWSACALAHLKDSKLSPWIYGIAVPVMYVIAGGHAFTMALMLGFLKRKDGFLTYLSLAAGLIILLLCGRLYNLTLTQTLLWPVYPKQNIADVRLLMLQPFLILLVMVLSKLFLRIKEEKYREVAVLVTFLLYGLPYFNVNDKELESVVKIGTLAYRNDWNGVRKMVMSEEPNRYSDFYWNLCNAREGRLADELLNGRWGMGSKGLFLSTGRSDPSFSMMYFTDALLEIGDVSQATDCALLAMTVTPGHYSTRMLRRLAEISVVTGDYMVASKYLNILSRTRNHREWADDMLKCIEADSIPELYQIWRTRTAPSDHFFAQGDIRSSLYIIAQESPYNKVAIDYLLCSYLLDKNVNSFIGLYDRFYLGALDQLVNVPEIYQEALLINVNSNESLRETVEKYHISQRVVEKFIHLMEARASSQDPHVITDEAIGSYWNYIMAISLVKED